MAGRVNLSWIVAPFAVLLALAIAGIGSAWMGGSARIPFVAGLDSYMPSWLGKVHPKYATPHAALIVQAIISTILVSLNFYGWWFWDQIVEPTWLGFSAFDFDRLDRGVSETVVSGRCSAARAVPVHVWCAHQVCFH